jgi:hypothetical protein
MKIEEFRKIEYIARYFIRVESNWSEVAIDDSTFVTFTPEIKFVKYILRKGKIYFFIK